MATGTLLGQVQVLDANGTVVATARQANYECGGIDLVISDPGQMAAIVAGNHYTVQAGATAYPCIARRSEPGMWHVNVIR